MFNDFIVQPIFNLLVLIYALIPGHNFGLAIILFTVVIRLLMWPLVKKQLRQTKITRALQPELKRIKKEAKGDRQKEGQMMMELYKERGVNPLGMFPTLIVQMVVLIGLYIGLVKVIKDPNQLVNFAYAPLQHLPWMQHLAENIKAFDNSLFGVIDLSRAAVTPKATYLPALILVILSAGIQFLTSRQLMPRDKDARKLRHILKAAGDGQPADQSEVNAAVGRSMQYFIPIMVFVFTINLAAALSLYWFTGGVVAYLQQRAALKDDAEELVEAAEIDTPLRTERGSKISISSIPEADIVKTTSKQIRAKSSKKAKKKRR
ncbi:MAG: YidC/Oxa1 family membrane protein insertase [Candidatus Saccharimonadales bacterium]|jgi:YidC/Oxa1 family membrane protein insertase|nr:membrane protein insertase YidC [Candidatus Saccharibacteria bacterium]